MAWNESKDIEKIRRFCAYQERSRLEVARKLQSLGCPGHQHAQYLAELEEEDYLSNDRFAHAYARGKFRIKGWGKALIRQGLLSHGIQSEQADQAIEAEIPDDEYLATLQKWSSRLPAPADWQEAQAIKQKLLRKGFESHLIDEVIRNSGDA